MSIELELTPKSKRAKGERCCEPVVYPDAGLARLLTERQAAARSLPANSAGSPAPATSRATASAS
jgi:hypothetical protein